MVHERTTGGAGLRPATPARPAPAPAAQPTTGADGNAAAVPAEPPVGPGPDADALAVPSEGQPPVTPGPVPEEEAPLDPRAIARASLTARRNASLWWVSAGIVVAVAVSLVVGTRVGSVVLAAVVATCGIVRWAAPAPGPVALSVRSRWIDVSVLFTLALGLGVLAAALPDGWF